ncbi:GNAT family N-acetyltransferase [Paracoccaceae bacterium]|nr:GNAT family N-acetyltransferase [Paracoccaceae bacterium]
MREPAIKQDIIINKKKLLLDNIVPNSFITNSHETYDWIWLPSSDAKQLIALRNAEHVLSNMRNSSPITLEAHMNFLQKYKSLQRVDLVLVNRDRGQYVGGMNISLSTYGFEIGKYIGHKNYLGKGIAYPMSVSFIRFVQEHLREIVKIRAVTRIDNFKNINLNFKLGFRIIQRVEEDYWLMEIK